MEKTYPRDGGRSSKALDPAAGSTTAITDYIEEGAHIAAILFVWGIIAVAVTWLFDDVVSVSGPGAFGAGLGGVFWLTGVLNAVPFVAFRTVDHYRR